MPHTDSDHGLRVQLATALRELEDARSEAATYKQRYFEKGADSQQWAAQAGALCADVKRLRNVLVLYSHCRHACVECFCFKEARAALCTGGDRG